jgi:hypothetical protein
MKQCLVTALLESVNNPDIPIIDTISDFTLAAITASGNNTLSNEQKFAVENFFRTIGATKNTGIWTKLDYVFLPILSTDIEHTLVDYKTNQAVSPDSRAQWSNHGISASSGAYNTLVSSPMYNAEDFSVVVAVNALLNNASAFSEIQLARYYTSESATTYSTKGNGSYVQGSCSMGGSTWAYARITQNVKSFGFVNKMDSDTNTPLILFGTESGVNSGTLYPDGTFSALQNPEMLQLRLTPGISIGFAIFGRALTSEELTTVLNAISTLQGAIINS